MIGTTLSHYRVLEKIGEGGMGVVYLAEDLKLGRKVAVKVLPEALTWDPGRRERFLQEARAAAFVEHPHIAAVHEVDDVNATLFVNNLPMRDGPARVKRRQGDLAGALEEYATLLRAGMANKWTSLFEPRYVLELARLHDELGQPDKAREEYAQFLDLWKNADPNLPEKAEATKRLARR